jgi:Glucose-regulated metallo-peptidase M90
VALSKLLSIPVSILMFFFLYQAWEVNSDYSKWIIACLVPLALLYIMSAEIDWWWYERNPPQLEAPMAQMLEKGLPFYQKLDAEGKKRFGQKVAMFILGNEWIPETWEEVPRDVQVGIAAQAVIPLFDRQEWIYPNYETIVVAPEGFLSPDHPFTHFHETNQEDKAVLFSAKHIMLPLVKQTPRPYLALYEYARIALECGYLQNPMPFEIQDMLQQSGVEQIMMDEQLHLKG